MLPYTVKYFKNNKTMDKLIETLCSYKQKKETFISELEKRNAKYEKIKNATKIMNKSNEPLSSEQLVEFYNGQHPINEKCRAYHRKNFAEYFGAKNVLPFESHAKMTSKDYYNELIQKLTSLNIKVITANIKIDTYKLKTITLFCTINNYSFNVKFCESMCGYENSNVKNIKNVITNEDIKYKIDLSGASKMRLQDFSNFLNNVDLEKYFQNKFNDFMMLPDLLQKNGFTVSCEKNVSKKCSKFFMCINVTSQKGECNIAIIALDEILIYVLPDIATLNKLTQSNASNIDKYSLFTYEDYSYIIKDYTSNDFNKIINSIDCMLNYLAGNYGYYDKSNGKYYNDDIVSEFCVKLRKDTAYALYNKTLKENNNDSPYEMTERDIIWWYSCVECINNTNNYNGLNFEVIAVVHPNIFAIEYYKDMEFLIDFYGIKFTFDKKVDSEKCYVTLQGKYFNACCDEKNKVVIDTKYVEFSGDFEYCFNIFKELVSGIVKSYVD